MKRFVCVAALVLGGCGLEVKGESAPVMAPPTGPAASPPADHGPPPALNADQRLRADRLISVFENDTIEIDYAYVEDIQDGRGYTCGRGFTTRTGDAARVVRSFAAKAPEDRLSSFADALEALANEDSGDTSSLGGFPEAWKAAAALPTFRASQDAEVDRASFDPAVVHAKAVGVKSALGITILYDTVFMHGDGPDADGTPALVAEATRRAGGAPKDGIDEHAWLERFLAVRRADLTNAHDESTRDAWAQAATRVDVLSDLLSARNDDLHGPLVVGHGYDVTVP